MSGGAGFAKQGEDESANVNLDDNGGDEVGADTGSSGTRSRGTTLGKGPSSSSDSLKSMSVPMSSLVSSCMSGSGRNGSGWDDKQAFLGEGAATVTSKSESSRSITAADLFSAQKTSHVMVLKELVASGQRVKVMMRSLVLESIASSMLQDHQSWWQS